MTRYCFIFQVPKTYSISEYEDFVDLFPIKDCTIEGTMDGTVSVSTINEKDIPFLLKELAEYSHEEVAIAYVYESGDSPLFSIGKTVWQILNGWDEFGTRYDRTDAEIIGKIRQFAGLSGEEE